MRGGIRHYTRLVEEARRLGDAYRQHNDTSLAIAAYERYLEMDPSAADWWQTIYSQYFLSMHARTKLHAEWFDGNRHLTQAMDIFRDTAPARRQRPPSPPTRLPQPSFRIRAANPPYRGT